MASLLREELLFLFRGGSATSTDVPPTQRGQTVKAQERSTHSAQVKSLPEVLCDRNSVYLDFAHDTCVCVCVCVSYVYPLYLFVNLYTIHSAIVVV